MSKTEDFLSVHDEQEVIEAIAKAEKNTSGEIRVHLEENSNMSSLERAKEVFNQLGMYKTELKNGVLIYINTTAHTLAIIGDEGINNMVDELFWETTKNTMIQHFKNGFYKTGLVEGILLAGEQLKKFFPYDDQNDTNELSNEISRG